jgi:2-oxoglutarate ferredoxin oxidoreductase subunit gamma
MQEEVVFAGFGGQGVLFAGQLLAYAAMDQGRYVTWIPSYGPEMRGGTAHCIVTVSDEPIGSPVVKHPSVVAVFNTPSFDKYDPLVAPGGLLVVNSSLIAAHSERDDIQELLVPATELADEMGDVRLANMIVLGALMTARPILPLSALAQALDDHLPAHRRRLLEADLRALERGAALAQDLLAMA